MLLLPHHYYILTSVHGCWSHSLYNHSGCTNIYIYVYRALWTHPLSGTHGGSLSLFVAHFAATRTHTRHARTQTDTLTTNPCQQRVRKGVKRPACVTPLEGSLEQCAALDQLVRVVGGTSHPHPWPTYNRHHVVNSYAVYSGNAQSMFDDEVGHSSLHFFVNPIYKMYYITLLIRSQVHELIKFRRS